MLPTNLLIAAGAQSLLAMWTKRIENVNSQRHVEFYGRLASDGNKAQLYPNIEDDSSANQANNPQNSDRQRFVEHCVHFFYYRR